MIQKILIEFDPTDPGTTSLKVSHDTELNVLIAVALTTIAEEIMRIEEISYYEAFEKLNDIVSYIKTSYKDA